MAHPKWRVGNCAGFIRFPSQIERLWVEDKYLMVATRFGLYRVTERGRVKRVG